MVSSWGKKGPHYVVLALRRADVLVLVRPLVLIVVCLVSEISHVLTLEVPPLESTHPIQQGFPPLSRQRLP